MAKAVPNSSGKASRWTRQTLPRLLLIIGSESVLREEAILAARKAAFGAEESGMNCIVLHGPAVLDEPNPLTPADILDEVCTASMFAAEDELKVVLLRQGERYLAGKEWREIFERNVERIPESSTLIIEAAQYGHLKSSRLYKMLAAAGAVVECDSLLGRFDDTRKLQEEIDKRARAKGLALSYGALQSLLNRSTKNLGVIQEELDKLALALLRHDPEKKEGRAPVQVTEHDIEANCATTNTFNAFNFVDAIVDRDARRALEVLGGIFDRGIADNTKAGKIITNETSITLVLLGALTWKLSQLQDVRAAIDSGMREYDAFIAAKVNAPFVQEQTRRLLKKHSGVSLRHSMDALYRANLEMRMGGHRPQELLEQMVWRIVRHESRMQLV